jgi:hypothetical protein
VVIDIAAPTNKAKATKETWERLLILYKIVNAKITPKIKGSKILILEVRTAIFNLWRRYLGLAE